MTHTYQNKLQNYASSISDVELRKAVQKTLGAVDFWNTATPASLSFHHCYDRGLLVHTLEVVEYALSIAGNFNRAKVDVLTAAAICHDVCKVREYETKFFLHGEDLPRRNLFRRHVQGGSEYWVVNDQYRRTIHHIQGGFAEFYRHSSKVNPQTVDEVSHAILAHHGPVRDWGSNVAPSSLEATILHQADYLSAHYGPAKDGVPT